MANYGQIRYRLSKLAPGVDLELVDGWIQDRYTAILDALPWKRLEGSSVFQVPESYATGTIAATRGSNVITGTGTAWVIAMGGRTIRINNGSEYYTFTFVDATSATIDRPFEQATAGGLAYRIDQAVFLLPESLRILRAVVPMHDGARPLEMISAAELDRIAPQRTTYGTPVYAAYSWDSFNDPPFQQVELYPAPSCPDSIGNILSYAVDYIYDPADIDATATSASLLPWVRPAALIAGVTADIRNYQEKFAAADRAESQFVALVKQMAMISALQRGPQQIRIAREYQATRAPRFKRGPVHEGFTG